MEETMDLLSGLTCRAIGPPQRRVVVVAAEIIIMVTRTEHFERYFGKQLTEESKEESSKWGIRHRCPHQHPERWHLLARSTKTQSANARDKIDVSASLHLPVSGYHFFSWQRCTSNTT
jgi:hypothetical protein